MIDSYYNSPYTRETSPLPYKSDNTRKKRKFLMKAHKGVACALSKGYRFRWFVLTESDDAITACADFGHEFNKFIVWLRYYCPDFQYVVVEHRQGDLKRRNWHILSYGSDKLPLSKMRDYWLEHFHSTVTGMAEIEDINKSIKYLAGYMLEKEKFVRSWASQGWVFPGWLGITKRYYKSYYEYPSDYQLVQLSNMTKDARNDALPDYILGNKTAIKKAKSRVERISMLKAKPAKLAVRALD